MKHAVKINYIFKPTGEETETRSLLLADPNHASPHKIVLLHGPDHSHLHSFIDAFRHFELEPSALNDRNIQQRLILVEAIHKLGEDTGTTVIRPIPGPDFEKLKDGRPTLQTLHRIGLWYRAVSGRTKESKGIPPTTSILLNTMKGGSTEIDLKQVIRLSKMSYANLLHGARI